VTLGFGPGNSGMKGKRSGIILLSVSWCVLILSLLLVSRLQQAEIGFQEQRISKSDLNLRLAARSVLNMVLAGMVSDAAASEDAQVPEEGTKSGERESEGAGAFDAYSDAWGWQSVRERYGKDLLDAYPGVDLNVVIEDEDSKINLGGEVAERLAVLLERLGWPPLSAKQAAAAAMDLTRQFAKENGGEQSARDESQAEGAVRNPAGLYDLRYLLALPSLSPEILYGEDLNFNGEADSNENDGGESWPPDDRDGSLRPGLGKFVTLWGDGKVNPNLAPLEVLMTVPGVSGRIAEEICRKRAGVDGVLGTEDDFVFKEMKDLQSLASVSQFAEMEYQKMESQMRMSSSRYTIRVCAADRATGQMHRIQACVERAKKGNMRTLSYLEDMGF
jgi:hypothetical protein